jgi:hypothetical protein
MLLFFLKLHKKFAPPEVSFGGNRNYPTFAVIKETTEGNDARSLLSFPHEY